MQLRIYAKERTLNQKSNRQKNENHEDEAFKGWTVYRQQSMFPMIHEIVAITVQFAVPGALRSTRGLKSCHPAHAIFPVVV